MNQDEVLISLHDAYTIAEGFDLSRLSGIIDSIGTNNNLSVENIQNIKQVLEFIIHSGLRKPYQPTSWDNNLSELLCIVDQDKLCDVLAVIKVYSDSMFGGADVLFNMNENTAIVAGGKTMYGSSLLTNMMHHDSFNCSAQYLSKLSHDQLDALKKFALHLVKKIDIFRDVTVLHNFIQNDVFKDIEDAKALEVSGGISVQVYEAMRDNDPQFFKILHFIVDNKYATLEHFLCNARHLDKLKVVYDSELLQICADHLKKILPNPEQMRLVGIDFSCGGKYPKIEEMGIIQALTEYGSKKQLRDELSEKEQFVRGSEASGSACVRTGVEEIGCCSEYCNIM